MISSNRVIGVLVCVSLCICICVLCAPAADVLSKDSGECSICLEELLQGDTIARLACLCVYHKKYLLTHIHPPPPNKEHSIS